MARTKAAFAGGNRLSDCLGVSVIARVHPRDTVDAALRSPEPDSWRRRDLPAKVMVCRVIVMALFQAVRAREVRRCPEGGLRWVPPDLPVRSSIPRARTRLAPPPFSALRDSCVVSPAGRTAALPGRFGALRAPGRYRLCRRRHAA